MTAKGHSETGRPLLAVAISLSCFWSGIWQDLEWTLVRAPGVQSCVGMWFRHNMWKPFKKNHLSSRRTHKYCHCVVELWGGGSNSNQRASASTAHYRLGQPMGGASRSSQIFSRSVPLNPLSSRLESAISTPQANPTERRSLITSEDEWASHFLCQGLLGWWYCRCHLQNSCSPHRESQAASPGACERHFFRHLNKLNK